MAGPGSSHAVDIDEKDKVGGDINIDEGIGSPKENAEKAPGHMLNSEAEEKRMKEIWSGLSDEEKEDISSLIKFAVMENEKDFLAGLDLEGMDDEINMDDFEALWGDDEGPGSDDFEKEEDDSLAQWGWRGGWGGGYGGYRRFGWGGYGGGWGRGWGGGWGGWNRGYGGWGRRGYGWGGYRRFW